MLKSEYDAKLEGVGPLPRLDVFAVFSSKCNICCISNSKSTPFISLNSQRIMISYNINHIFVDEKIYQLGGCNFER